MSWHTAWAAHRVHPGKKAISDLFAGAMPRQAGGQTVVRKLLGRPVAGQPPHGPITRARPGWWNSCSPRLLSSATARQSWRWSMTSNNELSQRRSACWRCAKPEALCFQRDRPARCGADPLIAMPCSAISRPGARACSPCRSPARQPYATALQARQPPAAPPRRGAQEAQSAAASW